MELQFPTQTQMLLMVSGAQLDLDLGNTFVGKAIRARVGDAFAPLLVRIQTTFFYTVPLPPLSGLVCFN